MQKAIFGITAKVDDGSVFGVLLAQDHKTPISPCFNMSKEKLEGFKKIGVVVEKVLHKDGSETVEKVKA